MPGGVSSPVRAYRAVGGEPPVISYGSGSRVVDVDGNNYIDYVCAYGPLILGHANPAVVDVLAAAAIAGDRLRRDERAGDRAAAADRGGDPVDRYGALRQLRHGGDDVGAATGARVHGPDEGGEVRGRVSRPRGRAARAGGVGAGDAQPAGQPRRAAVLRRGDAGRAVQRRGRRSRRSSSDWAERSPP